MPLGDTVTGQAPKRTTTGCEKDEFLLSVLVPNDTLAYGSVKMFIIKKMICHEKRRNLLLAVREQLATPESGWKREMIGISWRKSEEKSQLFIYERERKTLLKGNYSSG